MIEQEGDGEKKSRWAIAKDASEACRISIYLTESDGIWCLDHTTAGIARRKTEQRLDYARWSKNIQGERRWALVGVEKS
jgi:hypothetical protein